LHHKRRRNKKMREKVRWYSTQITCGAIQLGVTVRSSNYTLDNRENELNAQRNFVSYRILDSSETGADKCIVRCYGTSLHCNCFVFPPQI
jgi:hypothetical protein